MQVSPLYSKSPSFLAWSWCYNSEYHKILFIFWSWLYPG